MQRLHTFESFLQCSQICFSRVWVCFPPYFLLLSVNSAWVYVFNCPRTPPINKKVRSRSRAPKNAQLRCCHTSFSTYGIGMRKESMRFYQRQKAYLYRVAYSLVWQGYYISMKCPCQYRMFFTGSSFHIFPFTACSLFQLKTIPQSAHADSPLYTCLLYTSRWV